MRKLITTLSILITNLVYSQVSSNISIDVSLYREPQSITSISKNWRVDTESNRELGAALLLAGFTTTALCIYEGNETWKRSSSTGWKYDPFISQSTRPFMMTIGVSSSLAGLYFLLK
jgi:hypothetical protein